MTAATWARSLRAGIDLDTWLKTTGLNMTALEYAAIETGARPIPYRVINAAATYYGVKPHTLLPRKNT